MWQLVVAVVLLFHCCDSVPVECRDENDKPVDWYILYKLPQQIDKRDKGLQYVYMDETTTNGWKTGTKPINDNNGVLANTLRPLSTMDGQFGYILYSDQPPSKKVVNTNSFGHSKGVVMLNRTTGVWLSHSLPKFPVRDVRNADIFRYSRDPRNAQTFLCMTYPYKVFKEIGTQLMYLNPYVYDHHIPPQDFHTELKCEIQKKGAKQECHYPGPESEPWFREHDLTTLNGVQFKSVAKYKEYGDDLYSGLLVKILDRLLNVRTWRLNGGPLPCNCTVAHPVKNILKGVTLPVVYDNNKEHKEEFTYTVDHSKWCVTGIDQNGKDGWTCIADLNREESQMGRSGGAICIQNGAVWRAFNGTFDTNELCVTGSCACKKRPRDS